MTKLLFVSAALAMLPFMSSHAESTTKPVTVLCFGDSITAGNALPKEDQPRVWTSLVGAVSEGKVQTINEGKGGRPTDSVAEFRAALQRHPVAQFDILVIALGMNDSRDVSGQCTPKAVKHITEMVTIVREANPNLRVLLVGPTNIAKEYLGPSKNIADQREQNLKDLNAAFEKLAAELKTNFVSLYGLVPADSLKKDGVHPDVAANEILAKTMTEALLKVVNGGTKEEN